MKHKTKDFLKQWKSTLVVLGLLALSVIGLTIVQGAVAAWTTVSPYLGPATLAFCALVVIGFTVDLVIKKDKVVPALKVSGVSLLILVFAVAIGIGFPVAKEFAVNNIPLPLAIGIGVLTLSTIAGYFVRKHWAVIKPWFLSDRGKTITFVILTLLSLTTVGILYALEVVGVNGILVGATYLVFLVPFTIFNAKIRAALSSRTFGVMAIFFGVALLLYFLVRIELFSLEMAEIVFGSICGVSFLGWLIWYFRRGIADKWTRGSEYVKTMPSLNWKAVLKLFVVLAVLAGGGVGIYYAFAYEYLSFTLALIAIPLFLLAVWLVPKATKWIYEKVKNGGLGAKFKTKLAEAKAKPRPSASKIAKVVFWLTVFVAGEYGIYLLYVREYFSLVWAIVSAVLFPVAMFLVRKLFGWLNTKRKEKPIKQRFAETKNNLKGKFGSLGRWSKLIIAGIVMVFSLLIPAGYLLFLPCLYFAVTSVLFQGKQGKDTVSIFGSQEADSNSLTPRTQYLLWLFRIAVLGFWAILVLVQIQNLFFRR